MNYLYLLVDLGAIIVPLIFSFHPKIKLYQQWGAIWPAIFLTAAPFIIWDSFFTKIGVWGFNPKYLCGIYLFNLPIEEILFFICIPYACMFTYYVFRNWKGVDYKIRSEKPVTALFLLVSLAGVVVFRDRWYTLYALAGLFVFLGFLHFVYKCRWLSLFYFSHMFLLVPFFIVNGILTGTGLDEPVVWYNNAENVGVRLFTIPVEDVFYGMFMLLMNAFIFEIRLPPKTTDKTLEPVAMRK
ncbi:lycopene cyclase domain-containing protein [Dyadobacter sandarakinus]|uniref:Lycopene cyclase domain-containing protein n=1 Tax=Dyadobacter sandarakinus TaxID=2747268 RepID=A0ABX7I5A6_9BACT|nr:lycopene cyclase domain-containing protein [Dyadobacter sandarakinus]QRR00970.1 lycopene cyclase domain-containing protein [Dyadobacter sandarakinus]